jgi:hypothetical protein
MTVQEIAEITQENIAPAELQKLVMQIPIANRLNLLKLLVESLQPEIAMNLQANKKRQWSSEFLSTFGSWRGEALARAPQEEQPERDLLE